MPENETRTILLTPDVCDFYGMDAEFHRMPDEIAAAVSPGVRGLSKNPAGGRVRFATDSKTLRLKAEIAAIGTISFDIYAVDEEKNEERFITYFPYPVAGTFEPGEIRLAGKMRTYTLNFPYNAVINSVSLTIDAGARFERGARYRNELPVVFYGSSITTGAWAFRPGNAYIPMLSHRFNLNYLNFGFSGNAKGEPAIAEYLASLPMCAFVLDYDHNAPTPDHLEATHRPFYEIVRAAHPDIPILMMSRPNAVGISPDDRRTAIVRATYEFARARGDNVRFIDGARFFAGDFAHDCMRDGCHPNDLGFYRMASVVGPVLAEMLGIEAKPYDVQ